MNKINTYLFAVFTVAYFSILYSSMGLLTDNWLAIGFLTASAWACGVTFSEMMDEVFGVGKWRL